MSGETAELGMFVGEGEASRDRWALGEGEAVGVSWRCPGKASGNEDAGLVMEVEGGGVVLAVADGAGGMPGGAQASRVALEAFARELDGVGEGMEALVGSVLAGFDRANEAVIGMQMGAGTTLSVVVVRDGVARAFHAGDSMVLITGQRGRVRARVIPHSPTGYGVESGLMTEDEALAHEERSLVLNLLGFESMRVEIGPRIELHARDTVLVASDGLSDNLVEQEIVQAVRSGAIEAGVDRLAELTRAKMLDRTGHADDLTIVAYRPTVVGG